MRLKIMLPTHIYLEKEVTKVIGHALNGSFCLLTRHIDFVTTLTPGLLYFETEEKKGEFHAIDSGTLVKCGQEVLISTRRAIGGADIGKLKEQVEQQFHIMDEQERKTRSALAKLEMDFIRRFVDLGK